MITKSKQYLPIMKEVIDSNWKDMPLREIPFGQVEQESSWKKEAKLETSRERGLGLTQITTAYDKNGKERFNNFKEATKLKELKSWNWKEDPYNVKFQLTYLILQDRSNYKTVSKYMINPEESFKAALVSYNAGPQRIIKRRTFAKLNNIPTDRWDGGLANACSSSELNSILYGKNLCETVNDYPVKIFKKSKKYKGLL